MCKQNTFQWNFKIYIWYKLHNFVKFQYIAFFREDDNDRSDDDEDDEPSRMKFTINTGAVERQKIRETFLSLQEGK